jgi:EAL domain-containing protein (putative c-di-GMP-specific phosphodiesterase class I)
MSTTVEGVETSEQFAFSVAEGCDTIQEHHISTPFDRAGFAVLLDEAFGRAASFAA